MNILDHIAEFAATALYIVLTAPVVFSSYGLSLISAKWTLWMTKLFMMGRYE